MNVSVQDTMPGRSEVVGAVPAMATRWRVLLVDEQAHVIRVMRINLERCGCRVDAASTAELALQLLQTDHPDAMIVTSDLPDMSAAQLAEHERVMVCRRPLPDRNAELPLFMIRCKAPASWPDDAPPLECLDEPLSLTHILLRLGSLFVPEVPNAESDQNALAHQRMGITASR